MKKKRCSFHVQCNVIVVKCISTILSLVDLAIFNTAEADPNLLRDKLIECLLNNIISQKNASAAQTEIFCPNVWESMQISFCFFCF